MRPYGFTSAAVCLVAFSPYPAMALVLPVRALTNCPCLAKTYDWRSGLEDPIPAVGPRRNRSTKDILQPRPRIVAGALLVIPVKSTTPARFKRASRHHLSRSISSETGRLADILVPIRPRCGDTANQNFREDLRSLSLVADAPRDSRARHAAE
jgi:hypothetical protein